MMIQGAVRLGLMVIAGLAFGTWSLFLWHDALKSRSWPTVPGVVVSSKVVDYEQYDTNIHKRVTYHQARVVYAYRVGDRSLTSSQIRTGGWAASRRDGWVDRHLRDYPVGREVLVYYNPGDPRDAYLEPGNIGPAVVTLILASGLLLVPLLLMIVLRTNHGTASRYQSS